MNRIKNYIKDNSKRLIGYAVLLSTFILILILNTHTHYLSDDFRYHFFYKDHLPSADIKRIGSLGDVIPSMVNHWKACNGRVVVHGLLQIILQGGEVFFDIFNSLMYVLLGILIYKHSAGEKRNLPLLIGIYLLMWFFIPQFGATCLWASGSANYLWGSCIILAYLLPYRMYGINQDKFKDSTKNAVIMGILGLFAGCTNENSGGALALACILFIGFYKVKKIKIPTWSYCGVASTIIGAFILLKAPGNYRIDSRTDLAGYINRFKDIYNISLRLMFILLAIYLTILFIYIYNSNRKKLSDSPEVFSLLYIIPSFASIFVMTFSALHPERTWFIGIMMFICATGYLYSHLELHKYRKYIPIAVFTLVFVFSFANAFKDINHTYKQAHEQIVLIKQAKKNGERTVRVPFIQPSNSKYDSYAVAVHTSVDPNAWQNQWMCKYYDMDQICAYK